MNNIIIPVCEDCHEKINAKDIRGMYSYLYRVKKTIEDDSQMIKSALKRLDSIRKDINSDTFQEFSHTETKQSVVEDRKDDK